MQRSEYEKAKIQVLRLYEKAGIVLREDEKEQLEVADFGLHHYEQVGLACVVYVNTQRCCSKEMVLLPGQVCPEHRHVPLPEIGYEGKEETFRCRYGTCYVYTDGKATPCPVGAKPEYRKTWYTAAHEYVLKPGMQLTLQPNTLHWFRAGEQGAVVSEFSTRSIDEYDIFTDPEIVRLPVIEE